MSHTLQRRLLLPQGSALDRISPRTIGITALVVSILAASTYNTFAKQLSAELSPFSLLFVSECLTLFFVLFSFGVVPSLKKLLTLNRGELLPMALIGLLSGTIGPILWFTGLKYTSALNASLFGNVDTLFLIGLAALLLGETITRAHTASAIMIGAGILIIVIGGTTGSFGLRLGDIFILIGSLSYSLGSISYRKFLTQQQPHLVLLVRSLTALIMFFLFSPFIAHPFIAEVLTLPLSFIPVLLGFGFISKFLCTFSYYESIERLPMTTVSLFSAVSVISGALFAHVYNGDTLAWYHVLGGLFLLGGTVVFEMMHTEPKTTLHRHIKPHHPELSHPIEMGGTGALGAAG